MVRFLTDARPASIFCVGVSFSVVVVVMVVGAVVERRRESSSIRRSLESGARGSSDIPLGEEGSASQWLGFCWFIIILNTKTPIPMHGSKL